MEGAEFRFELKAAEFTGGFHVIAIDRSIKAITQAKAGSVAEIESGQLEFRCVAIEDFALAEGKQSFDLAFAVRVSGVGRRKTRL